MDPELENPLDPNVMPAPPEPAVPLVPGDMPKVPLARFRDPAIRSNPANIGMYDDFRATENLRQPEPEVATGPQRKLTENIVSALRSDNLAYNLVADKSIHDTANTFDPKFDIGAAIVRDGMGDYADELMEANNEQYYEALKDRMKVHAQDQEHLRQAGLGGTMLLVGASVLDLPTLIPGGTFVKGARLGYSVGRTALGTAIAAGTSTALQEGGLHLMQPNRDGSASAVAIGGSVLLGGLLGGAGAKFLNAGEMATLSSRIEQDLVNEGVVDADLVAQDLVRFAREAQGGDAGAALAEQFTLTDLRVAGVSEGTLKQINKLTGLSKISKEGVVGHVSDKLRLSPATQLMVANSAEVRKAALNTIDTSLQVEANRAGAVVTSSETGLSGSAESTRKVYIGKGSMAARDINGLYKEARATGFAGSRTEFFQEVGKLVRLGAESSAFVKDASNPALQKAAARARTFFDEMGMEGVDAGIWTKADVDGMKNYFHRMWKQTDLIEREHDFKYAVRNWLAEEKIPQVYEQVVDVASRETEPGGKTATYIKVGNKEMDKFPEAPRQTDADGSVWVRPGDVGLDEAAVKKSHSFWTGAAKGGAPITDMAGRLAHIEDMVEGIFNRMTGRNVDVDTPDWIIPNWRGPTAERTFNIADNYTTKLPSGRTVSMLDFLENDVSKVLYRYSRIGGGEIALTKFHGSPTMKETFAKANREYDALAEALSEEAIRSKYAGILGKVKTGKTSGGLKPGEVAPTITVDPRGQAGRMTPGRSDSPDLDMTPEQAQKAMEAELKAAPAKLVALNKERADMIGPKGYLTAMRDMVRGTYGRDLQESFAGSATRSILAFNYMAGLGGVALASLTDAAAMPGKYGMMAVMRDLVPGVLTDLKGLKATARELQEAGTALEIIENSRINAFVDALEHNIAVSKTEQFIDRGSQVFSKLTLLPYWNMGMKTASGGLTVNRMVDTAVKIADGAKLKDSDLGWFTQLGLTKGDARFLKSMLDQGVITKDGGSFYRLNTSKWLDDEITGVAKVKADHAATLKRMADELEAARAEGLKINPKTGKPTKAALAGQARIETGYKDRVKALEAELPNKIVNQGRANRERLTRIRAALNVDVDRTIITPGMGDRPLWSVSSNTGRIITQFKSFIFAAENRLLKSGLQGRQLWFAQHLVYATGIGMAVSWAKLAEREGVEEANKLFDNPGRWIAEGFDRSGVMPMSMEINNTLRKAFDTQYNVQDIASKLAGDKKNMKADASRFATRNRLGAMLGPSFGMGEDVFTIANQLVQMDLKTSGVNALFRQTPGARLPYFRWYIENHLKPMLHNEVDPQ